MTIDPNGKVAVESATKTKMVCLLGETNIEGKLNYEVIARQVCKDVGFDDEAKGLDYKAMSVLVNIE